MLKEAFQYLVNMGKPEAMDVDGVRWIAAPGVSPVPLLPSGAEAIKTSSLAGLVAIVARMKAADDLADDTLGLVASATEVRLVSDEHIAPSADHRSIRWARDLMAVATPAVRFDKAGVDVFMPAADLVLRAQVFFAPNDERTRLLRLLSNIRSGAVSTAEDDGISQTVTVRDGIELKKEAEIANPFMLAPWRTFAEIEQPQSAFVLRAQGGGEDKTPLFGLFIVESGMWEAAARALVVEYLQAKLAEISCDIAVM